MKLEKAYLGRNLVLKTYYRKGVLGSNVNQPPVISDIVISLITDTTFRVTCNITPNGTLTPVLHYGETVSYDSTVNGSEISEAGSVVFNVTGLAAWTDYRVNVVAGSTELAYAPAIKTTEPALLLDAYTISDVDMDSGTDVYTDVPTLNQILWDKSKGKVLGDNICPVVTNWTPGTGWVANGGGRYTHSGGSNGNLTYTAGTLTQNRIYQVDYDTVSDDATGLLYLNAFGLVNTTLKKTVGHNTIFAVADAAGTTLQLRHNGNTSGSTVIENIVCRPVAGNHFFARATTKFAEYTKDAIAFDGSTDTLKSLTDAAATTYIVARKPGANSFEVFTDLTNIGELAANVLTIGSNAAASAFYGIAVKRIIRRNQAGTEAEILNFLAKKYPTIPASRIILPAVIDAVVGKEMNLFSSSVVFGTDDNDNSPSEYDVVFSASIGAQTGNEYSLTPTAGQVGSHTLTVNVFLTGTETLVQSKQCTLNVIADTPPASGKIITMVGDSIHFGLSQLITTNVRALFTTNTPTFEGLLGTAPNQNEGHSGWSYYDFATGQATSPFLNASVIDIDNYKTNLGITDFSLISFQLGSNTSIAAEMNDRARYVEITECKKLVAALLADNPAIKIVISLPTTDCSINGELVHPTLKTAYQRNVWRLREMLIAEFDLSEYSANVVIGVAGLGINRYTGYSVGDAIHPNSNGYGQMANVIFPTFLKMLQ